MMEVNCWVLVILWRYRSKASKPFLCSQNLFRSSHYANVLMVNNEFFLSFKLTDSLRSIGVPAFRGQEPPDDIPLPTAPGPGMAPTPRQQQQPPPMMMPVGMPPLPHMMPPAMPMPHMHYQTVPDVPGEKKLNDLSLLRIRNTIITA